MLVELDPDGLENAFQIGIGEKADFERTFALAIAQLHFGAETLAQPRFQVHDMHVSIGKLWSSDISSRLRGPILLQPGDHFLGLTDIKFLWDDPLGREPLLARRG